MLIEPSGEIASAVLTSACSSEAEQIFATLLRVCQAQFEKEPENVIIRMHGIPVLQNYMFVLAFIHVCQKIHLQKHGRVGVSNGGTA